MQKSWIDSVEMVGIKVCDKLKLRNGGKKFQKPDGSKIVLTPYQQYLIRDYL